MKILPQQVNDIIPYDEISSSTLHIEHNIYISNNNNNNIHAFEEKYD